MKRISMQDEARQVGEQVKLRKRESGETEERKKKKRLRKYFIPLSVGYGMPDNPFLFSECLH